MVRFCCVAGCSSQLKRDNVTLFPFPVSMRVRQIWTKFCGRPDDWQPPHRAAICHHHFVDSKPTTENPNPTVPYKRPKPGVLYLPPPDEDGQEGPRLLFRNNAAVRSKRSHDADDVEVEEDQNLREDTTKTKVKRPGPRYATVDRTLTKWYEITVKHTPISFARLKLQAESIAQKRRIQLREKFYVWLNQWAQARNIAVTEDESDRSEDEASTAAAAIAIDSDQDDDGQDITVRQDNSHGRAPTLVDPQPPTGQQALEALDILRRYLGNLRGAELEAMRKVEKQVHSKVAFSAFVASIQK